MPGQRGPVPVPLQDGNRDITQEVLDALSSKDTFDASTTFPDIPRQEIKAALDRLASRSMVQYTTKETEEVTLTAEGEQIRNEGSHEWKVWNAVKTAGQVDRKELTKLVGQSAGIGSGKAAANKWIKNEGSMLVLVADSVKDETRDIAQSIHDTKMVSNAKQLSDLKKRKLVTVTKQFDFTVEKGPKYAQKMPVEYTDLTAEMLASGEWETATFKPYNFRALGAPQEPGSLHPLNKVRKEFRDIFFNLGFVEMPTSRFVETGFWNFDSLFVPQQHPARDLQDTFYLSDPAVADKPRPDPEMEAAMDHMEAGNDKIFNTQKPREPRDYEDYFQKIRAVHQDGAFGSIGYRYPWAEPESLRLVLRTHTTALTSWVLHRLAQDPRPAKYFSIDRVFRNETVDATHLAEFHQVEGVIVEPDLTLGNGMGFLEYFFAQLGLHNLRFKPAYNPYTEPSMEIFGYHAGLGKWIEIGNSGMFRPEMLEPMGFPKNLRVFGFGLSVERPTMIKYAIKNIRELVGHQVRIDFIESREAVRLDK